MCSFVTELSDRTMHAVETLRTVLLTSNEVLFSFQLTVTAVYKIKHHCVHLTIYFKRNGRENDLQRLQCCPINFDHL